MKKVTVTVTSLTDNCHLIVMIYEINFPNFKQTHSKAFIVLCKNVLNATELKSRIISASITEGKPENENERQSISLSSMLVLSVKKPL